MYIYRVGHCPQLSAAEFQSLSGEQPEWVGKNFIVSKNKLAIAASGSLVWRAWIGRTSEVDKKEDWLEELTEWLRELNQGSNSPLKKVGLVWQSAWKIGEKEIIQALKAGGGKKINPLKSGQDPTFGNWSHTPNWLLAWEFQGETWWGQIEDFSNQEFWSQLDENLPAGEMSRGLMNLKLGRSLLNLSRSRWVWDPFVGSGRTLLSGLDRKEKMGGSDVSEEAVRQSQQNWEYAQTMFHTEKVLRLEQGAATELSQWLVEEGATNESCQVKLHSPGRPYSKWALVTEGYLGKNFTKKPDYQAAQYQLREVYELWRRVLTEAEQVGVTEIVGCLPSYRNHPQLTEVEQILPKQSQYKLVTWPHGETSILYRRRQTITGHLIWKVVWS
jgi:hypothetical protein